MYRLTPRMEQALEKSLREYHRLFDGGRCQSWELEELIVKAIRSDTSAQHLPQWEEGGHDDKADITVKVRDEEHQMQVKSGKHAPANHLTLSGHRLGRFKANLSDISDYLNSARADIISVSYAKIDDKTGRHHVYVVRYLPVKHLQDVEAGKWEDHGKQKVQTNAHGVRLSLRPSMSWQVWWQVPLELTVLGREIKI